MRRDMWIAAGVTVFVAVAFALTAFTRALRASLRRP